MEIPVSLKMRTGWNTKNKNAVKIAQIAENSGVQMLTVHGRTRARGFKGVAEYQTIQQAKDAVLLPVVANGGYHNTRKGSKGFRDNRGRRHYARGAALENPWIFREMNHLLETDVYLPKLAIDEIWQVILQHVHGLYELYDEYTGVRVARKHIAWYNKHIEGGEVLRSKINRSENIHQQLLVIDGHFNAIGSRSALAA